jgi:hypothetical protein
MVVHAREGSRAATAYVQAHFLVPAADRPADVEPAWRQPNSVGDLHDVSWCGSTSTEADDSTVSAITLKPTQRPV